MKPTTPVSLLSALILGAVTLSGCFAGAEPEDDAPLEEIAEVTEALQPEGKGGDEIGGGVEEEDPQPEPRNGPMASEEEEEEEAAAVRGHLRPLAIPRWQEDVSPEEEIARPGVRGENGSYLDYPGD
jgi:hypothetical protein